MQIILIWEQKVVKIFARLNNYSLLWVIKQQQKVYNYENHEQIQQIADYEKSLEYLQR